MKENVLHTPVNVFNDILEKKRKFIVAEYKGEIKIGDTLIFQERNFNSGTFTGRCKSKKVKYIFDDPECLRGRRVIFGL